MADGDCIDPYRNFNFKVEIDGITQARFAECTGFSSSNDPIEFREGMDRTTVRKLPGLTKFNHIILKWGLTDSRESSSTGTRTPRGARSSGRTAVSS